MPPNARDYLHLTRHQAVIEKSASWLRVGDVVVDLFGQPPLVIESVRHFEHRGDRFVKIHTHDNDRTIVDATRLVKVRTPYGRR
jgi:hypothetical protein